MNTHTLIDYRKLKERVSLADIIDHYGMELVEKGEQLVGECPICDLGDENSDESQNARTNFSANTRINGWKCFSCKERGNILSLVAAMEGVTEREASVLIAEWFGVTDCELQRNGEAKSPRKRQAGQGAKRRKPQRKRGGGETATPAENPVEPVTENKPLEWALQSLDPDHEVVLATGLNPEHLRELRGGYCSSGLMQGRIALPFYDKDDRLIGYCGVDDSESGEGRYKFPSPDKFNPALELFNLNFARSAITAGLGESVLCVVRDPLDALHMREIGYPHTVATVGDALTTQQARSISETTAYGVNRVAFLYNDLDELSGIEIATVAISQWVSIFCHCEEKPIRHWSAQDIVLN